MKKQLRSLLLLATTVSTIGLTAQAPRFVLVEHFTQASCGPCAAQNPGFESGIIIPNAAKVRHVAVHTSWPGVDPMYSHNPTESADRVTYYNVTGVPDVQLLGNKKSGLPNSIGQSDVDYWFSYGSPIKIIVSEVDNGSDRDVTVEVKTLSTPPSGTWVLRTAIVEDPIDYGVPPGSNGETHFPNVFRKMLPSTAGDAVVFASVGNSVSFNYNYAENGAWNTANLKVIAWVQNETTKEVLQSGSTNDPTINYTLTHPLVNVAEGSNGVAETFNLSSGNSGTATEDFIYTLTSDMPGDWSADFTINSSTYASTCTLTVAAGASNNIALNITPGTSPYVGKFTLEVKSADNPSSPEMISTVYVIANVTDLIVNSSGYVGDGTTVGSAANWGSVFSAGLAFAGNTGYASTNDMIATRLIENNQFSNVNNIYLNIGWTFPAFTDEQVAQLANFLDNGGNLFVAGQDIGWDTFDPAGNGTPAGQSFFTTYLQAIYNNDGGSGNNQLTTVVTDAIWGDMPNAGVITNHGYYAASYLYPEELTPTGTGTAIYRYNATAKTAGVRATNGTWKTVYVGVGMEQVSAANANAIIKRAHDWFYDLLSSTEDLDEISVLPNYPNPANEFTVIPLPAIASDITLTIADLSGKVLHSQVIAGNTPQVTVSTAAFAAGTYIYSISYEGSVQYKNRMTVVH